MLGGANKGFAVSRNGWWANYGSCFMNAAGGGFFNEDRTECALDSAESIAGMEQIVKVYENGWAVPFGEDGELAVEGRHRRHVHQRLMGNARRSWSYCPPLQPGMFLSSSRPVAVAPRATGCSGAPTSSAPTEHPQAARELVQALTSSDTQAQISELEQHPEPPEPGRDRRLPHIHPAGDQAFINGSCRTAPPPKARCGPATGRPSTLR